MTCGIYGIRNLVNGKWYVGQSVEVETRKKNHFSSLLRGDHYNAYLQAAFKKYGVSNFEFRILEPVCEELLDIREKVWILYYQSGQNQWGYNLDSGGGRQRQRSLETRRKIADTLRGSPEAQKSIEKMAIVNRGRKHSAEWCSNISVGTLGKKKKVPFSEERRKKVAERQWGKRHSDITKKKMSEIRKRYWSLKRGEG